jgi:phospholipid-transporting ATPase
MNNEVSDTGKRQNYEETNNNHKMRSLKAYKIMFGGTDKNKLNGMKDNTVKTTKYNLITFLPKSLMCILYRPELIYYLILIILENIPAITPVIPISTMVPYLAVLLLKMVREGVEDYFRYRYDKEINSQPTTFYNDGEWKETLTKNLRVGDLVLVKKDEVFPADLLLLDSDKDEGVAMIETSTLDGECSLKKKFPPKILSGNVNLNGKPRSDFKKFNGNLECDSPNTEIFKFNGLLEFSFLHSPEVHSVAVDNSQMLLKGARLKTNDWAVGLVVYTGHNTKLIQNLAKPKSKNSKSFNLMTKYVCYVFVIQFFFCIVSAILNYYNYEHHVKNVNYLPVSKNPAFSSFLVYFSYLIIYKFMVPITLYLTIEIVRVLQAYFIWVNVDFYSNYRKKFTKVNTISVVEELGEINFVFSDKTGTLTMNKMEMKNCIIGNRCFEISNDNLPNKAKNNSKGITEMNENFLFNLTKQELDENYPIWQHSGLKVECETNENIFFCFNKKSDLVKEFWKALALANECTATQSSGNLEYIGTSPDDIVLVSAAAKHGVALQKLDKASSRKLKILEEDQEFEILNTFEFSSERKKLSVIVRDKDQIKLFIKGADSELKKIMSPNSYKDFNDECEYYTDFFSKKGLRTLFVGMKLLDEQDYQKWKIVWDQANRNLINKETEVRNAQMMIEKDIFLLGATVVEDKLQEGIPETISDLRDAGIKVWMLTGDKMDTAYNISISCNMIHNNNYTFFANGEKGETFSMLKTNFEQYMNKNQPSSPKSLSYSIVIDSVILSSIFQSESSTKEFIEISNKAESVVCCRVNPLQKSQVIKVMKKYHPNMISLAIGDGGNDVSMIMEANVGNFLFISGVGVYGEEGLRAVNSADFAIGEFKILRNLLLIKGRSCNYNINNMIMGFFYKSYIFCLIHFFFGFYNCFSAQTVYDDWLLTFYNILFTFYPIIVKSFTDCDLKPSDGKIIRDAAPLLYKENRESPLMNSKTYFYELTRGLLHAAINFYINAYSIDNTAVDGSGQLADLWYLATSVYTNLILVSIMRISITARNLDAWYFLSIVFTTFLPVGLCMVGINYTSSAKSHAVMSVTWGSPRFYLNVVLVVGTCFIYDWIEESFLSLFSKKLSKKLTLLVKEKGPVESSNQIPMDLQETLKNYRQYETTTMNPRKEVDVVITELAYIKDEIKY